MFIALFYTDLKSFFITVSHNDMNNSEKRLLIQK